MVGSLQAPGDRFLEGDKVPALREHLRYRVKCPPCYHPFLDLASYSLHHVIIELSLQ